MRKIIIAIVLLAVLFSGCGSGTETQTSDVKKPDIIAVNKEGIIGYNYIIDADTGVVYLKYFGGKSSAISVMLNPDGTPVTAEQLGLDY